MGTTRVTLIVSQLFTASAPLSPAITTPYNPTASQVLCTFGSLQYAETAVAGTPNNFATTYSFEQNWPLKYEWASGAARGPIVATPYLGLTFNTGGTSTTNSANFVITIDQVELPFKQWQLLNAAQSIVGA